ncbi:protein-disulfide reductase DsbD family protein [Aquabacterium sp.]|uniref:protein-disulfide reductase DsbD family protein n=1 Tax=Aquabacterium sp. TaxID=1872578 RepID=UPI0037842280
MRRLIAPLLVALAAFAGGAPLALGAAPAAGPVVQTDQVRAELLVHAPEGLAPDKPVWLGLALDALPHWHTYWQNPGDSGLPTTLRWTLPAGASVGPVQWPTPQRLPVGPLVNYGYEGRLLLPVKLALPAGWAGGPLPVKLHAEWLVCNDTCIPQSGDFALDLPTGQPITAQAERFTQALAAVPAAPAGVKLQARVEGTALRIEATGLPAAWRQKPLQLFAAQAGVIDHAAPAQAQWQGDSLRLSQPLSPQRSESPEQLQVVLTTAGQPAGLALAGPVLGGWPAIAGAANADITPATAPAAAAAAAPAPAAPAPRLPVPELPTAAAESAPVETPWLLTTLGLAFVGGLLLNLMPCVFPVLSLKVLGLAAHGGQRRQLVAGGLAYAGGVLLSFLVLASLLLMMRAGGAELGWGFQLQSPGFVALLALLFTLIGLNLSGVFGFSGAMTGQLCTVRARRPLLDHALTGVLAVLVASPCTAPFMGAALGAALAQPPLQALSVFLALGLGMAAPYLVLCCWPRLARLLPRPGAWMEQLKMLLAFPMYATVVWLLWVLGHQVGVDGATALLLVLLLVAFGAWVWGSRGLGRLGRRAGGALAAVGLVGTSLWAWPQLQLPPAPVGTQQPALAAASERWQAWSPEAVQRAQAEGRPVLVDFTAAWCVTCQFNKHGVLANAGLLADLDARRVLLLRADWTRRDPQITQTLGALGRSGVPVYAAYGPGQAQPRLLPELLSVASVREAIAAWPVAQPLGAMPVP